MEERSTPSSPDGKYQKIEPAGQVALRALLQEEIKELVPSPSHAWEYGLTFELAAKDASAVFARLRDDERFSFEMLVDVTAVDYLDSREQRFCLVYQLLSLRHKHRLCLKIAISEDSPEAESLVSLYPAANFLEREVYDMYGIKFASHPDLRRILLYDGFVGYPLRKDYPIRAKQPRVPLRIPEFEDNSSKMKREELVALPIRQRFNPAT